MKKVFYEIGAVLAGVLILTSLMPMPVMAADAVDADTGAGVNAQVDAGADADAVIDAGADVGADAVAVASGIPTADGRMVSTVFPDEAIPVLFHKTTTSYQGNQVEAAQFDNGYVLFLYVTDASGANDVYMMYNEATGEMSDARMLPGAGDKFIIVLTPDDSVTAPYGFERVVLDWNGQTLTGFTYTAEVAQGVNPSEYILLYAMSSSGQTGLYLFDTTEESYQRYFDLGAVQMSPASSEEGGILDLEGAQSGNSDALIRLIIFCVMVLIIILLIIIVIVLAVKLRAYDEYDYIDEEEYNAVQNAKAMQNVRMMQSANAVQNANERAMRQDERNERIYNIMSEGDTEEDEDRDSRGRISEEDDVRDSRRRILETGDIADLDDILNDPYATSDLPVAEQIEKAARRAAKTEEKPAFEVTVDRFSAGMPAMVDTDMIAEDIGDKRESGPIGPARQNDVPAVQKYRNEEYEDEEIEDDEYPTYADRKERKALEKQRRREEKEAEKDAKYLEKERKKAEKRKKYGYEEPTAMDWSQFSDTVHNDDKDSRRPKGNNAEELPAYMKKGYAAPDAQAEAVNVQGVQENEKVPTEEERAMAAADAVIAAARGNEDIADDREDAAAYKQYRDGARNVYEQYRDEDIRAEKHAQSAPRPTAGQQMPAAEPPKPAPEFTQDLDDDFEFQFLNIKHDYQ